MQDLTQAFQTAQKYATDHPEDLGGITQRLEAVAVQANAVGGSSLAETCKQQIDSARITYGRRRDQTFYDLRDQATVFVARREFDKAIAVYRDFRGPFASATRDLREREIAELQKLVKEPVRPPDPVPGPVPGGPLPPTTEGPQNAFFEELPPEAAPLRERYEASMQNGDRRGARNTLSADLANLVKELTKQGRIDEAIKTREVQRRVDELIKNQ